jgi:hypothetical protein
MTGPEWDDAFDKGSPEAIGQVIGKAARQADVELLEAPADRPPPDEGERRYYTRIAQLLMDQGLIRIPGHE